MNIYNLSRDFWNFAYDNPDFVKPIHIAMYFFAIEHCNRLGWKQKFGLPASMTMEAIGVKSYRLYKKTFDDLVEWKMFNVHEYSKNQYSSNIIALNLKAKAQSKALDNAMQKHGIKQVQSTGESNDQSNDQRSDQRSDSINKPITKNIEQGVKPDLKNQDGIDYEKFKEFFNSRCEGKMPKVRSLSKKRKDALKARMKDFSKKEIIEVIENSLKSEYLTSTSGKNWGRATFDWIINETNFIKILEGNFNKDGEGNETLPLGFTITEPHIINGKGGIETVIHKETRLRITGKVHAESKDGEMRYVDEQGRLITEEEYNEKIQLQTH